MSEESIEGKLESEEVEVEETATEIGAEAEAEVVEEEEEIPEFSLHDLELMIEVSNIWDNLLSSKLSINEAKKIVDNLVGARRASIKAKRKVAKERKHSRRKKPKSSRNL